MRRFADLNTLVINQEDLPTKNTLVYYTQGLLTENILVNDLEILRIWYQQQCILLFSNLYLAAYDYLMCTSLPQKFCVSLARRCSEKRFYILFHTCSKFASFWYWKQCFGLFWQSVNRWIVLFGLKSIAFAKSPLLANSFVVVSMLIVSEKNSCVSVFGPFLVPKTVHLS